MKIAFIIFDGMTLLDFIGVYDPLTRLKTMNFMPYLEWDICAKTEIVSDSNGLQLIPNKVAVPLNDYDMIIIPGGFGTRKLVDDISFLNWIRTANLCKLKVSVCTGSLILGAAGFLKNKKATTHYNAFKNLEKYCLNVVDDRIVEDGDIITARGVSSSIDLGLYLVEKYLGPETKEKIQKQMDYLF
ncbi:MAG TPA: DJ-1/PfpI family protein [Desulfotomaculum sp.]|nr:MAG: thiamine biosynthesis protein ThiJ [Desulfotomaculum sp. BICA1-6]HBX23613.1 DJ-1/PfpI family protein [Desulfotomaculum sp.]